ncbi:hypothetical protein ABZS29_07900 [Kribbella sp. NPDC005582]|uniref:hypothetical protein n=1 Tax=Kribbella sp. NPDC005582 TaxID=3156893 RepID=UPI0033B6F241
MASRGTALLASALVAMIAIGGAGGYGVGWLTALDRSVAASGKAMPLGQVTAAGTSTPMPTAPPTDPRNPVPDDSSPLQVDDLSYRSTTVAVTGRTLRSTLTLDVPDDWKYVAQDPPNNARFNESLGKRWLRVEGGFPLTRPPSTSMAVKLKAMLKLQKDEPNQHVQILSQIDTGHSATLTYRYVPDAALSPNPILKLVIVRWVADDSGKVMVEMSVTGLPQDEKALRQIIDRASDSVVREDSTLAPS